MNTLSLFQPWASLIMIGAKPFEFRKWNFTVRSVGAKVLPGDRIVIHATARAVMPHEVKDLLERLDDPACTTGLVADKARALLERLAAAPKCRGVIELSAGLGTAVIGIPQVCTDVMPGWKGLVADSDRLEHCRWAWPMTEILPWERPVRARGNRGFWQWPTMSAMQSNLRAGT